MRAHTIQLAYTISALGNHLPPNRGAVKAIMKKKVDSKRLPFTTTDMKKLYLSMLTRNLLTGCPLFI
jgi:hypothetical protein